MIYISLKYANFVFVPVIDFIYIIYLILLSFYLFPRLKQNENTDKGTFYIDTCFSFTKMFLYGNERQLFILEFLLLLAVYLIFTNLLAAVIAVCIFNKVS